MTFQKGDDQFVARSFRAREFDCPCSECKETLIDALLLSRLQVLRDRLGSSIQIHSGYRCSGHQAALAASGYPTVSGLSQHELGRAADLSCGGKSGDELNLAARMAGFSCVGVAATWIHVDIREGERSWKYPAVQA